jgi:hypothetical protein
VIAASSVVPARYHGRNTIDLAARPALHLLQSALVHVNTLLLQSVLEDPEFHDLLDDIDRRALSPLFWTHINLPYGRSHLDMDTRLDLNTSDPCLVRDPRDASIGIRGEGPFERSVCGLT